MLQPKLCVRCGLCKIWNLGLSYMASGELGVGREGLRLGGAGSRGSGNSGECEEKRGPEGEGGHWSAWGQVMSRAGMGG